LKTTKTRISHQVNAPESEATPQTLVLNLGCGDQTYGDVRIDRYKGSANVIVDLETKLPFMDNIFDEVYSRWVFEHFRNPGKALDEMARVCKPGGMVIIITDNAGSIGQNWPGGAHAGGYAKIARGSEDRHYSLYALEHMKNHFDASGLNVVELRLIHGTGGRLQEIDKMTKLSKIFPILTPFIYAHIYARAVKPKR